MYFLNYSCYFRLYSNSKQAKHVLLQKEAIQCYMELMKSRWTAVLMNKYCVLLENNVFEDRSSNIGLHIKNTQCFRLLKICILISTVEC